MSLIVTLTLFFLCVFSSCQKEIPDYVNMSDSTEVKTGDSSLVRHYVEDIYAADNPELHTVDSFALSYDEKGRLTLLQSFTSSSKFVYDYTTGKQVVMDMYENDSLSIHEVFFLNSSSYVDSTFQYNNDGDTTTEKYIYAGKNITEIYYYDYTAESGAEPTDTTRNTYDSDGNLSSKKEGEAITTYGYEKKTANNLNIGLTFYPLPKYLPDTFTYIDNSEVLDGTHTYISDNQNRLILDKAESNGITAEKRYYYK